MQNNNEISVKTVNMMDLRRNIGSVIDEVIYTQKEIIIKKHGKPVCVLLAVPDNNVANPSDRRRCIERLYGSITMSQQETEQWLNQGKETDQKYNQKIREAWEKK